MKNIFSIIGACFALLLPLHAAAQNEIAFRPLALSELKALAAKEKKPVFIDCFTSWCGPCRWMDKNVFVDPKVATFYNGHFINARFDMEKGEGVAIRNEYKVTSFPTYLFIDEKGVIIHRSGGRMEADNFIAEAQRAADPKLSFPNMQKEYAAGRRDLPFLMNYYLGLKNTDARLADEIGEGLVRDMPESQLATALGLKVISELGHSEDDRLGKYFLQNTGLFKGVASAGKLDSLKQRMLQYKLYATMRSGDDKGFRERLNYFKTSADTGMQKQAVMSEVEYYLYKKQYAEYVTLAAKARTGLLRYDAEKLSFLARAAHRRGMGDPATWEAAYQLARQAVAISPDDYSTQSTLSQICVSLRKKEEGMAAAQKALSLAETTKVEANVKKTISELEKL
ncbi:thioredoxin family protein [Chitinophaga arvensicola]|uniref:Thioredoxin-like n=1 Tax=Chitinophaga arvensicola TaxID=29529 RepID=A0A1I0S7H7_9BACT|nr:thioredoxin family protein [Chitinophaga arvensicola]SEW51569.1 Thioredoxin-like [Chitinophaga arvensicola]